MGLLIDPISKLQANTMRIFWQAVRRITNEILGVMDGPLLFWNGSMGDILLQNLFFYIYVSANIFFPTSSCKQFFFKFFNCHDKFPFFQEIFNY